MSVSPHDNTPLILAQYKRLGIEPLYASKECNLMITPSLAARLGVIELPKSHLPAYSQHEGEERWRQDSRQPPRYRRK
jgi:hypothetical protein